MPEAPEEGNTKMKKRASETKSFEDNSAASFNLEHVRIVFFFSQTCRLNFKTLVFFHNTTFYKSTS
jgi:hypothetical protein